MAPLSTASISKAAPVDCKEEQLIKDKSGLMLTKEELEERKYAEKFSYFKIINPTGDKKVRYIYVDENRYGIVWPNLIMFTLLHAYYFYGMSKLYVVRPYATWLFGYIFTYCAGIGVTCGAHRLWSHRGYKATLPLRTLMMLLHTCAGQNDLYTWVRDHRLHHKFTETDADPHNSRRGMFFAHVGWLLTKKHPDVIIKGRTIDMSDILADPVVRFQRRFYVPLYLFFRLFVPIFIPCYFWNEFIWWATIGVFAQYIGSLHATWFVNSAAHLFGDRPYNHKINPRNNDYVNFVALGEGHHNYHHTFPWDYAIDEHGSKMNIGKRFIDLMARFNLAYDLKKASPQLVQKTKQRVLEATDVHGMFNRSEDPYVKPHEF